MVQFKALVTYLLLIVLLIFASLTTTGVGVVAAKSHDQMPQRVNHGSFRGPRKHLLNPAAEHALQLPKLPV
ncbi:hypothetical protein PTKIN_Ptkin04bG0235100 [Pterospermum kingtungense]